MKNLSDNAILFWMAHFRVKRNTLAFGGDHAEMEITPEARLALNELLEIGAVVPIPPLDQWPGREYYGSGETDLLDEMRNREHLNPFNPGSDATNFILFRKKENTV